MWNKYIDKVSKFMYGRYGPDDPITRQDLCVMLRNYANYCGLKTNINADHSGQFADFYDFRYRDKKYLEKTITEHMGKILTNEGKEKLRFTVQEHFTGGQQPIITISMITTDPVTDFKPNRPRHGNTIMEFNFTKGQYYYK